ncbi:MAG: biotin/lipoyl-binding protein, partial [Rhodospirillales bacterium]|nr:biotin/lipoyl-binding protein [Rhodospirillales bacterium]
MAARSRRILLVLLALGIVLAGGLALRARRAAPGTELTLYGNVDIREVQAAFNDSGKVARMMVTEGALVHRGELIATLDDTRYAASLTQAEGQMEVQRQTLAALLAG